MYYEVNGSSALQEEYIEIQVEGQVEEQVKEAPQPEKKPVVRRRPRKRGLSGEKKAAIFMSTLAASALAAVVLTLMASLNTGYRTLDQKKQELSSLEAKVEQLASETEGAAVISATEEQAAEMGLYKISRDQIVYISLENTDSGEILAEDNSNVGISAFFNKVAAIAEYFY